MRSNFDIQRSLKDYCWLILGELDPAWEVRLASDDASYERPLALVMGVGEELTDGDRFTPRVIQPFQVVCYPKPGPSPERSLAAAAAISSKLWLGFKQGVGLLDVPSGLEVSMEVEGDTPAPGPVSGVYWYRVAAFNRYGETLPGAAVQVTVPSGSRPTFTWTQVPGAKGYRIYRGGSASTTLRVAEIPANPAWVDDGTGPADGPIPALRNRARAGHPNRVPIYAYDDVPVEATLADPVPRRSASDYAQVRDLTMPPPQQDDDDPTLYTVTASVRLGWRRSAEVPSDQPAVVDVGTTLP
jgi:hypothetical protein